MGNHNKLSLLGAVALLASVFSAQAADITDEPQVVELPQQEAFGGWYLRGDISVDRVDDFDVTYLGNSFITNKLDKGYNFGVGIGYQLTENFRTDVTIERFGSDFSGTTGGSCAFDGGGVVIAGSCASVESADFTAWSAMANAYFDLGTFSGFTPYAGAGIGASYVTWEDYVSLETCTRGNVATDACYTVGNANYVAPGAGAASTTTAISYEGESSWRFSYSLMAGFTYNLSRQLKLDVGYKYTNIVPAALLPNIGGGVSVDHSNLGIHAARVGLRYQVW